MSPPRVSLGSWCGPQVEGLQARFQQLKVIFAACLEVTATLIPVISAGRPCLDPAMNCRNMPISRDEPLVVNVVVGDIGTPPHLRHPLCW